MPDAFAGSAPNLAFVLDARRPVVGYVVGCPDTAAFVTAVRERWLPLMRGPATGGRRRDVAGGRGPAAAPATHLRTGPGDVVASTRGR